MFKIMAILISLLSLGHVTSKKSSRFEKNLEHWEGRCVQERKCVFKAQGFNDDDVIDFVKDVRAGHFKSLRELILDFGDFGDFGAEALAHMLDQGYLPNLQALHLQGSKIDCEGKEVLRQANDRRPDLIITGLKLQKRDYDNCKIC